MADYDGPAVHNWEVQMRDKRHLDWATVTEDQFHKVRSWDMGGAFDHHARHPSAVSSNQHTQRELAAGSEYQFRVRAQNAEGFGEWSEPTSVTTKSKPPARPEMLHSVGALQYDKLTLALTEPATFGAAVRGYAVQRRSTRAWYKADVNSGEVVDVSGWFAVCELPPDVMQISITDDVEAGASHSFRYCAISNAGDSAWSETLDITLPVPQPASAPTIMSCQVTETGAVSVSWPAPPEHGCGVTGYELWSSVNACEEWQLIYTGFSNSFVDEQHAISPHDVRAYRVRALTDQTPPSKFSVAVECELPLQYRDKIPVLLKGPWGPEHQQLLWVSRDEPVQSLRFKVPPELYPTGKIKSFGQQAQLRLSINGKLLCEDKVPVPYNLIVSDEAGRGSYITGHEVVMARDVSFAQVLSRLLRYFDPALRDEQQAVEVVSDPTGNNTVLNGSSSWPACSSAHIELAKSARVAFRKCAVAPEAGKGVPLPSKSRSDAASACSGGAQLPLYDLAELRKLSAEPLLQSGTAVVPLYQREALWMEISSRVPVALKVLAMPLTLIVPVALKVLAMPLTLIVPMALKVLAMPKCLTR